MPNEITDGYKIECLSCSYVWNTKYSQISAKCPSCSSRIYGTGNYTVHTRYIHYEKTEEEKERTRRTVGMSILGFFIFISLMTKWIFGLVLFSAILGLWAFMTYKKPQENISKPNLSNKKSIKVSTDKKEVKTTLACPKCGQSINYTHQI